MNLTKVSLFALALPAAFLVGCGDDSSAETGTDPASTTDNGSTSDGMMPTTMQPTTMMTDPSDTAPDPSDTDPDPSDTDPDPDSSGSGGDEAGFVSVLHLGVDAPGVDVFANGAEPAAVPDLMYRMGTPYLELPAAEYMFQINPTGVGPADPVLEATLNVEMGMSYTAAAIGVLGGDPALQILPLVDNVADIDAGNVRITVIHGAPAAAFASVDVWEISDPGNPMMLLEDLAFADVETLPDLPAEGSLMIGLDINDDATPDATFEVDVSNGGGAHVNVFASSDAEGGDVALVAHIAALGAAFTIPAM